MKEKQPDEFRKFDDVMRGLLAVPYQELQEKLEEEKRAKAKAKQKKKRPTSTASSVRASSSRKTRAA